MKRATLHSVFVAAGLAGCLGAGAAQAADTHPAWIGFLDVTANTASCAGIGGTAVGDHAVMVYRPQFATGDTATISAISIYYLRTSMIFLNSGAGQMNVSNGTYSGRLITSKARYLTNTGGYNITSVPATVAATTVLVSLSGTITNFLDVTGCNVSFKASLTPEN